VESNSIVELVRPDVFPDAAGFSRVKISNRRACSLWTAPTHSWVVDRNHEPMWRECPAHVGRKPQFLVKPPVYGDAGGDRLRGEQTGARGHTLIPRTCNCSVARWSS